MNYLEEDRPLDVVDEHVRRWARELPGLDARKEEILARIERVRKSVDRAREDRVRSSGLTSWQFKTLVMLRREGPPYEMRPSQLADLLGLTRGAMSNRLTTLETLGLIERVPRPGDRRAVAARLTASGLRQVEDLLGEEEMEERSLLSGLTDDELDELLRLLRLLGRPTAER